MCFRNEQNILLNALTYRNRHLKILEVFVPVHYFPQLCTYFMKKFLFSLILTFVVISTASTAQWLHYDKAVNPKDSNAIRTYNKAIVILKNGEVILGAPNVPHVFSNGLWDAYPPDSLIATAQTVNMVKDSLDNLWVASSYGLKYYDTKLRKLTKHYKGNAWARDTAKSPGDNQFYYLVAGIAVDSNGGLWLSGWSNGYDLAYLKDGKWTLHQVSWPGESPTYAVSGESGNTFIEVEKNGCVWYNSYLGIVRFNPATTTRTFFDTLRIGNDIISFKNAGKIHIARDGTVWLNAQNGYILNFNTKDSLWTVYGRKDIPIVRSEDSYNNIYCRSAAEDAKGNIWMALHPDYLAKFDITTKKWKKMQLPDGRYTDIKTFLEYGLAVDSKGQVWVGTLGEGVFVYTGDANAVEEIAETEGDNLAHTWIFSVTPNPITKRSNVKFFADPGFRSSVHIGLYSLQGIEMLDLTSTAQINWSTGHGTVEVVAGELPSGVYLFRVSNGGDNYVSLVTIIR